MDEDENLYTRILFSEEVETYVPPLVGFTLTVGVVLLLIMISE